MILNSVGFNTADKWSTLANQLAYKGEQGSRQHTENMHIAARYTWQYKESKWISPQADFWTVTHVNSCRKEGLRRSKAERIR